jgi:hypothetical protein
MTDHRRWDSPIPDGDGEPAIGGPVNMTDDEMQALYEPGANTVDELPDGRPDIGVARMFQERKT